MRTKWAAWVFLMAIIGVLVLSMVGALIGIANAQEYRGPKGTACGWYGKITTFYALAGKAPVARGLGTDGKVIEVLANEVGNFTILVVWPKVDKWSCVVRHGVGWGEVGEFLKEDKKL